MLALFFISLFVKSRHSSPPSLGLKKKRMQASLAKHAAKLPEREQWKERAEDND